MDVLLRVGLTEETAANLLKNEERTAVVMDVLRIAGVVEAGCDRALGNLLVNLATKLNSATDRFREELARYVAEGKIKSNLQLQAALDYLKSVPPGASLNVAAFEEACGVGVDVGPEEVRSTVAALIDRHRQEMLAERYRFNMGKILFALKEGRMKWADGKEVKEEVDRQVLELLGPKTAADEEAAEKAKGKKGKKAAATAAPTAAVAAPAAAAAAADEQAESKRAGKGFEGRILTSAINSERLLEEHARINKGRIITRFPPEPNGFLHIGHAKSLYLNFCGAFKRVGKEGDTIFRYDDTNPEAESQEYIDSIRDYVHWLGWRPCRTTFSSDYFEELYGLAVELIRRDKAFVCHQSKAEMEKSREIARSKSGNPNSPWRDRPVEESLRLFEDMRKGKFAEGEAVLRMKIDMTSPNPCMWDPVAYRIKYCPHPHVGDKWCIYPSYDFTHCIVDALEHIDYSLCTSEFEVRRDSYYWLLEALDLWRPMVWEFGRLNLTYTVLSKRKLLKLVKSGSVRGWDDPRLCTLAGLRRRGFTPEAINSFCEDISAARTSGTVVEMEKLEASARADMDANAPRTMAVLQPLRVVIDNFPADALVTITVPDFPAHPERGSHTITFQREIFIDRDDFKEEDEAGYFGLAPGKRVRLKYCHMVRYTGVEHGEGGSVDTVHVAIMTPEEIEAADRADAEAGVSKKKNKVGNIHWVAGGALGQEPRRAEVRLYDRLFLCEDPSATPDWEAQINPHSELVVRGAMVSDHMVPAQVEAKFQFERVGYFAVDKDSTAAHPVFNRTITLRESTGKKQLAK